MGQPDEKLGDNNQIDVMKELSKITNTLLEMKQLMTGDKKEIMDKIEDTVKTGKRNEKKIGRNG